MQLVTGAEDEAAQIATFTVDREGALLEARQAAEPLRAIEAKATEPLRFLASFAAGTLIPVFAALFPMDLVRKMSIREALGFF